MCGVAKGLAYLHEHGVIHGDIHAVSAARHPICSFTPSLFVSRQADFDGPIFLIPGKYSGG